MSSLPPWNRRRAAAAHAALAAFVRHFGADDCETNIADLIADLGHLATLHGVDFEAALRRAIANWHSERSHPQGDGPPVNVHIRITTPNN